MLVYNEYGQGSSVNPRDMEALSCDFSRMLKDEIIPDFKLKCEGRIFPVHKNVLAARSKVFHAMFRNDMLESKTDSVDIKDLRVSILDLFLKFVYSGKLEDITVDTVADLYVAADRYSVRSLMSACSHYMIKNVSVENCLRYLKTADTLSDADLKAALASFVLKHPDVFKSAAWKSFSEQHPLLAKKILINCASSAQP